MNNELHKLSTSRYDRMFADHDSEDIVSLTKRSHVKSSFAPHINVMKLPRYSRPISEHQDEIDSLTDSDSDDTETEEEIEQFDADMTDEQSSN